MKWVEMTKEVESNEVEREKPMVSDNRKGIRIMDIHNIMCISNTPPEILNDFSSIYVIFHELYLQIATLP